METPRYLRKFGELLRTRDRLAKFYQGYLENNSYTFEWPQDSAKNIFRISYEMKEILKKDFPELKVEALIDRNLSLALSMDIANQEKHGNPNSKPRSGKVVGAFRWHLHIFDPKGQDRSEATIIVDDKEQDCLLLADSIITEWRNFLEQNNLSLRF